MEFCRAGKKPESSKQRRSPQRKKQAEPKRLHHRIAERRVESSRVEFHLAILFSCVCELWTKVTSCCTAAGSVSAGDALLLLQMCRYATANYAQLQGDNQHSVACVKELQQACELLQDTKAPSERLVTWTLQVLLANAQRLDTVITYDSSRFDLVPALE